MRTANPVLSDKFYGRYAGAADTGATQMTVQGTINKSLLMLGVLAMTAWWIWDRFMVTESFGDVAPWMWGGLIGGFVLCLIICFVPRTVAFLSLPYAACEGLFLGGLSAFVETIYPKIAFQAVSLTLGIFVVMLLLYTSRTIRATPAFARGVMMATGAIMFIYLIGWILPLFGMQMPFIHESSWIGIGFSLFVVVIAALNLILDFDLIERGSKAGAPKHMEWFGAFALLVTLVWLYIEVLWLLMKLRGRN